MTQQKLLNMRQLVSLYNTAVSNVGDSEAVEPLITYAETLFIMLNDIENTMHHAMIVLSGDGNLSDRVKWGKSLSRLDRDAVESTVTRIREKTIPDGQWIVEIDLIVEQIEIAETLIRSLDAVRQFLARTITDAIDPQK